MFFFARARFCVFSVHVAATVAAVTAMQYNLRDQHCQSGVAPDSGHGSHLIFRQTSHGGSSSAFISPYIFSDNDFFFAVALNAGNEIIMVIITDSSAACVNGAVGWKRIARSS